MFVLLLQISHWDLFNEEYGLCDYSMVSFAGTSVLGLILPMELVPLQGVEVSLSEGVGRARVFKFEIAQPAP